MYKLQENGVKRLSDNASIPNAPGNRHYQEYQEWLHEGQEYITPTYKEDGSVVTEPYWKDGDLIEPTYKEDGSVVTEPYWKGAQVNFPEPQYTQTELDEKNRQEQIQAKRNEIREKLKTTTPPQTNPELSARINELEILLGIKEPIL